MSRNTKIFIRGLSRDIRIRDIEDEFGRFGRLTKIDMRDDHAFVHYDHYRDASAAVHEMNGFKMDGVRLTVKMDGGRDKHRSLRDGRSYGSYYARRKSTSYGLKDSNEFRGSMCDTKCYNCGKDGHYARDCREGDWSDRCYRCHQRGHISRECKASCSASTSPRYGSRGNLAGWHFTVAWCAVESMSKATDGASIVHQFAPQKM